MAIVSPLSKINETEGDEDSDVDDESDSDHEFPLRLERAALGTLKSRGQQLHENYDDQRPIEDEINEWAIEHEINLDKGNLLAIVPPWVQRLPPSRDTFSSRLFTPRTTQLYTYKPSLTVL
jgi:hypothetical protein